MKTISRILSIAVTLSLLTSLLVIAPLSALDTLAPEPELLWTKTTAYDVTDIATGDLNGDGKDDVVAIENEPFTLNAISGADGSILWTDASIRGFAVAIGDITGDGQNEVIAGGYYYSSPEGTNSSFGGENGGGDWVINAYAANGTLLWTYATNDWVHDIEIGDIDGDGIDDVVACNDASSPRIYVLDGDGNDLPGWPVTDTGEINDLAVGQLDGEDGMDVAAIGGGTCTLYVYDSSGGLLWQDHDISGVTVEIGDVNGDGDNEVVAPYYGYPPEPGGSGFGDTGPASWVFAFDGDDGGEPLYDFFVTEGKTITDIELGDLDGEPGVEIAAITEEDNTLYAIDIDNYSSEQEMWRFDMSWPNTFYGESLAIGDVDRDYKNEVVAASSYSPHYLHAFDGMDNDGDGVGDLVWAPYSVEKTITDVEIGDLNGDGVQDVVFGTTADIPTQPAPAFGGPPASTNIYAITKYEEPFTSATGTGTVYIDSDPSTIGNPTAIDPATLPDEGKPDIFFPHGLFSFNITGLEEGQTATITFTLPEPLPTYAEFWKWFSS